MSNLLITLLLGFFFATVHGVSFADLPSCYATLPWDNNWSGSHHWPMSNTGSNPTHRFTATMQSDMCRWDNRVAIYADYETYFTDEGSIHEDDDTSGCWNC